MKKALLTALLAMTTITVTSCGMTQTEDEEKPLSIAEEEIDDFYYDHINPIHSITVGYSAAGSEDGYYNLTDTTVYSLKASCIDLDAEELPNGEQTLKSGANGVLTVLCENADGEQVGMFLWDGNRCIFFPDAETNQAYLMESDVLCYILSDLAAETVAMDAEETSSVPVSGE